MLAALRSSGDPIVGDAERRIGASGYSLIKQAKRFAVYRQRTGRWASPVVESVVYHARQRGRGIPA